MQFEVVYCMCRYLLENKAYHSEALPAPLWLAMQLIGIYPVAVWLKRHGGCKVIMFPVLTKSVY